MSTLFLLLFFGFIAYRIIASVMGTGFDVSEEARKKLEARRQSGTSPVARQPQGHQPPARQPARQPQARQAPQVRGNPRLPPVAPRRTTPPSMSADAPPFDWYIVLDVPVDASRREILEAVKRRLEVAEASGDTQAPARIARAAAAGMKLRPGNASARERRQ